MNHIFRLNANILRALLAVSLGALLVPVSRAQDQTSTQIYNDYRDDHGNRVTRARAPTCSSCLALILTGQGWLPKANYATLESAIRSAFLEEADPDRRRTYVSPTTYMRMPARVSGIRTSVRTPRVPES